MYKRLAFNIGVACAISSVPTAAFPHEIQGWLGAHWHAADVLGFVVAGCLAALVIWLSTKRK